MKNKVIQYSIIEQVFRDGKHMTNTQIKEGIVLDCYNEDYNGRIVRFYLVQENSTGKLYKRVTIDQIHKVMSSSQDELIKKLLEENDKLKEMIVKPPSLS